MILSHLSWYDIPEDQKRFKPLWWHEQGLSFTRSGYGKRIPTTRQIKLRGRWRRVYCCIFSNSGTCYIQEPGGWIVVGD